jgi:ParB family chromosome partitioning protein
VFFGPPRTDAGADASTGAAKTSKKAAHGRTSVPSIAAAVAPAQRQKAQRDAQAKNQAAAAGPDLVPVPGARFAELKLTELRPNAKQPRQVFDEDALAELAESVKTVGLLQPIVVRPLPKPEGKVKYEIIMGERRWRAVQAAGLKEIPAIVRDTSDEDMLRDALLENLHRAQLNPLEEAAAYQQMMEDFGLTQEELSKRVARSRPQIANTLRLLKLPPSVQRRLASGVLSAGHGRALLRLEDPAAQERLALRIVAEGLSVRAVEELVALGETGAEQKAERRPAARRPHDPTLDSLQDRLSDRFDTRVTVNVGKRKGKVTIEFATVDDLNRILQTLAPGDPGLDS